MFENKLFEGIYYSMFVASWIKAGGYFKKIWANEEHTIRTTLFRQWLESLCINGEPIPRKIINEICEFANNGKFELERNASRFIAEEQSKQ